MALGAIPRRKQADTVLICLQTILPYPQGWTECPFWREKEGTVDEVSVDMLALMSPVSRGKGLSPRGLPRPGPLGDMSLGHTPGKSFSLPPLPPKGRKGAQRGLSHPGTKQRKKFRTREEQRFA